MVSKVVIGTLITVAKDESSNAQEQMLCMLYNRLKCTACLLDAAVFCQHHSQS